MTMLEKDDLTGLIVPKGSRPPAHTWECKKGHRRQGAAPFRLQFKIGDENVMETKPLCAPCFRAWLERQFGVKEVVPVTKRDPDAGRELRPEVMAQLRHQAEHPELLTADEMRKQVDDHTP